MTTADSLVNVVIVHFRSGGMLLDLLSDLERQTGCRLEVHVVESGDDGTLALARQRFPHIAVHDPGRNVGYAGGNNIGFAAISGDGPVLVVNPDVRIADATTVSVLRKVLDREPMTGGVAPVIVDSGGRLEYVSSLVDARRARAIHTDTHVDSWPDVTDARDLEWLDGACLLIDRRTLAAIGGFDERFFLIAEEVDWCLRARAAGWRLLLSRDAIIEHQRSASFSGSTKSAYYAPRNEYLLFLRRGTHWWRWHWARRWLRAAASRRHLRSGQSRPMLRGMWHGVTGQWGPAPEDRAPTRR